LAACATPEATPEPPTALPSLPGVDAAATPTRSPIGGEMEGEAADQAWARIQSLGRMSVGTAADYPPFEFYNENFQLDGFDIALIRAIGQELGVVVDIADIAFEGLDDSLAVQQTDVAIASLSITPEREAIADFSNVYYVGEDAVLAASGSGIGTVRSAADMAPYTVGVQARSVYERWVRTELIETGLMPEENLFLYARADQAVTDLVAGRVQLVMMDKLPAEVATRSFDLDIVGQGLNRQRFAIALPQGEETLRREINRALTNLQNEGVLADLARQYLDLSEVPPIEPVEPDEGTGPVEVACLDAMAFVGDLNLDDQNMTTPAQMAPGQAFRKGWRVQNAGSCVWNSNYSLAYAFGNVAAAQMGGTAVPVIGTVQPGQTYDFWADLVAPTFPGTYQGFWEMRNDQNQAFGLRVWVGIQVPGAPTPVPQPTQTPVPNISFTVDRTNIKEGECVTFSWDVQNIQAVWFYPQGQDFNNFPTTGQNSSRQCPRTTTTYILRVQMQDGTVTERQITIFVEPSNTAPKISSFSVKPPSVQAGQCVQVSWVVEGTVDRVSITRDGGPVWNGAPVAGTTSDCPSVPGFAVYVIQADGPGGSARLQQNVSVLK
jgi:polar amino acid transport system substrate-binding protein